MELLIQIGIVIVAIAFIILMYSIVQTMKVLKSAIEEMRLMIGEVRSDVSRISDDMKETIHNTNEMTVDIRHKLSSLNIVFAAVNDIGQAIQSFTGIAKSSAAQLAAAVEQKQNQRQHQNRQNNQNSSLDRQNHAKNDRQEEDMQPHISSVIIDGVISSLRIWKKIKRV